MVRYLLLTITFLLCSVMLFAQDASIQGKVTDQETNEPIIFGSVALYKNGVLITGTETDFDGNYSISPIDPGTYSVEVSYLGYQTQKIEGFVASAGKANKLDVQISDDAVNLDVVEVVAYTVPLIEQDNTTQGGTLTSDQIRNLPTRNINALAATTAGVASSDEGGALNIRGSRSNGTDYYLDGIRVFGSMVPQQDIDQLQVITGGIEARYGDVTGGIISITTKGPSSKFAGGVEFETSQLFDNYNYNLASVNVSGPILKKKTGESIIGFRLSGQYLTQDESDPPATPLYRAKDDVIANLEANPILQIGGTPVPAAEFLTNDDVLAIDARPFSGSTNINLVSKIDFRLAKNLDVSFTGTYVENENQFTPGGWLLLNAQRNPTAFNDRWRTNVRLRHRLGGNSALGQDEDAARKSSLIQNVSYTLQFGYEKSTNEVKNPEHGDNLWRYGHVGTYDQTNDPSFYDAMTLGDFFVGLGDTLNSIPNAMVTNFDTLGGDGLALNILTWDGQSDYSETLNSYTASPYNPLLSNYVDYADDFGDITSIDRIEGVRNSQFPNVLSSVWGLNTNVGAVYNNWSKGEGEVYTFQATTSFELVPGGSEKGRHNLQFGILYEQRVSRGYGLSPFNLYDLGRQLANAPLAGIGLDSTNQVGTIDGFEHELFWSTDNPGQLDTLNSTAIQVPIYGFKTPAITENDVFFQNIREVLGVGVNEYVNIDGIDPNVLDQYGLSLFSPLELTNGNFLGLGYNGYDYLGNRLDDVTFNDFFTERDANGVRTFPVAAFRPNYAAAFISDKFTFRDIIFRLGLRVDRYDANTKVLKDQYSFSDIMGASDFHSQFGGDRPGTIGDDFKVYINNPDSPNPTVQAYRDGETWYDASGTQRNSASEIFTSIVNPAYVLQDEAERDIRSDSFKPEFSFEDYKPQINWMPRLAFSFPISDEANFFAHYDILVQRPPSNVFFSALNYYWFADRGGIKNNPNLRPERTIDYEVGFQQKLSNSSALKLAAYYRELRDMIQSRFILGVPVDAFGTGQYETYDNLDFGTVKGFTVQYDLRRTNNVTVNIAYTLQFADGTGSNANSSRSISSRGIQRTLFPLSFDERHRIVTVIDYRFGSGKRYNGPRWFGADVFANAGANLQLTGVSGRPYTRADEPAFLGASGVAGTLNGSRLPWNFTVNLQVDKSFTLTKPSAARQVNLNVFMRVSNLLDRRNTIGVYRFTGSSTDDGYIRSSIGEATVNQIATDINRAPVESFLASYQWSMLNPNLFSLPRRMYLGAIIDF